MTKMRPTTWHERPRMNRLASVMYPQLADPQAKAEMDYYAKSEGKLSPMQGTLARDKANRDQAAGRITKLEQRSTQRRWWEK